jgi:hypothetical protein
VIVDPEQITAAAETLFVSSEALYSSVKAVADESDGLVAGEFTGIAEAVEASRVWMNDYIATLRCDIEDFAMFLAVHAETMVEADEYTASQFTEYAEAFTEFRSEAPTPVRPGLAPEDQLVRDGQNVAV